MLCLSLGIGLALGGNDDRFNKGAEVGTAQAEMHRLREETADYRHLLSSRQADTTPTAVLGVRLDESPSLTTLPHLRRIAWFLNFYSKPTPISSPSTQRFGRWDSLR